MNIKLESANGAVLASGKLVVMMNVIGYDCKIYVIKQGDTLYSISRRFNVPLALILRANPYAEVYSLQIGDELCIPVIKPVMTGTTTTYVVEENDTLQSIMEKFGIDFDELQQFNDLNQMTLMPGSSLQIPTFEGQ